MKARRQLLPLALLVALLPAHAGEHRHWSYSGKDGPAHWAELDPEFASCAVGKSQSPVELKDVPGSHLGAIVFDYRIAGTEVWNNGHTIQIGFQPGNAITVGSKVYALQQVHFHAPSEHRINGKTFAMEAHFVHADPDGNKAVVGVMFAEGKANPALEAAWAAMPQQSDGKASLEPRSLAPAELLPATREYFRYSGSLTTPPCSEGVTWLVLKTPLTASKPQIERLAHTLHHANNRPLQPLNARAVED